MATQRQIDAIKVYSALMEEIKIRISFIQKATSGFMEMPSILVYEFCHLQLRMIYELVALGCLIAHGDISETQSLKKEFSAGKIMTKLQEIHPGFYPRPVIQIKTGPSSFHFDNVEKGFLTRGEIVDRYNKGGDILHRGNLKKLLANNSPIQKNYPKIVQAVNELQVLLSCHRLSLLDGNIQIICMLRNRNDNEKVQVVIAEAVSPDTNDSQA